MSALCTPGGFFKIMRRASHLQQPPSRAVPMTRQGNCCTPDLLLAIRQSVMASMLSTMDRVQAAWPAFRVEPSVARSCFINGMIKVAMAQPRRKTSSTHQVIDTTRTSSYLSVPPLYEPFVQQTELGDLLVNVIQYSVGVFPTPSLLQLLDQAPTGDVLKSRIALMQWMSPTAPWIQLVGSEPAWVVLTALFQGTHRELAAADLAVPTMVAAGALCRNAYGPKVGCTPAEVDRMRTILVSFYQERWQQHDAQYAYSATHAASQGALPVPEYVDQTGNTYARASNGLLRPGAAVKCIRTESPYEARHRRPSVEGDYSVQLLPSGSAVDSDARLPFVIPARQPYSITTQGAIDPSRPRVGWACSAFKAPKLDSSRLTLHSNGYAWSGPSLEIILEKEVLRGTNARTLDSHSWRRRQEFEALVNYLFYVCTLEVGRVG
jgi:hypothetical protein